MTDATDVTPPPDHERTVIVHLTDAQVDIIAERVELRFYQRVGKKVVERSLQVIGLGVAVLLAWLGGKGLLK